MSRTSIGFLFLFSSGLLISVCFGSAQAQEHISAVTTRQAAVYIAPGRNQPVIGHLEVRRVLMVEGRNDATLWLLVHTSTGEMRGWVEASSVVLNGPVILRDLPVVNPSVLAPMIQPERPPLSTDPAVLAMIDRLNATPVLYNLNTNRIREIFQHGQSLGNRAGVFVKVGDSNVTSGDFLRPFGLGRRYCRPGVYSYLQETIDFFAAFRFQNGTNSFTRRSGAAFNGLSSFSALDPLWAPTRCDANESPVACENRLTKASVAIIMLGLMDVRYSTDIEVYRQNMEQIVQISTEQGVIPVLTTIVVLPDQPALNFDTSIRINAALRDIAEAHQTPLINLWAAVQSLPDYGIGPDRTHLKQVVGKFCTFDGAEHEFGGTLRNLLTLQTLDELRRNIPME